LAERFGPVWAVDAGSVEEYAKGTGCVTELAWQDFAGRLAHAVDQIDPRAQRKKAEQRIAVVERELFKANKRLEHRKRETNYGPGRVAQAQARVDELDAEYDRLFQLAFPPLIGPIF